MIKHLDIIERFSYIINIQSVFSESMSFEIKADKLDCEKLAKQWEVSSVEEFYADVHLSRWKRIGVRVSGKVHAKITQVCVITLEPLFSKIEESLGCIFVPDSSKLLSKGNCSTNKNVIEVKGPDIMPFPSDGIIDIGAIIADFAEIGINPYPRQKGVSFSDVYGNYEQ